MEIGLGLDARLALSDEEQRGVAAEAATLGYTSLWTPAGPDPFGLCALWHEASGLQTGISVLPLQRWPADQLIAGARTTRTRTNGHFTLGVGIGSERTAPIRRMQETIDALRSALGDAPIYLGALGPQMLRLAGERYDGAALNWSSPEQIAWSRERVAAGALRAGRDPRAVAIHQYIRVCIDPDEGAARRAFAKMVLGYAMNKPGADPSKGYRAHFARMGFDAVLTAVEDRQARGSTDDELATMVPDDLLALVGYWGRPAGAAAAFRALAVGLDIAIVRVVAPDRAGANDVDCVRRAMRACAAT